MFTIVDWTADERRLAAREAEDSNVVDLMAALRKSLQ